jgi:protein SCO1/2
VDIDVKKLVKLENIIGYIITVFIILGISMAFFLYPLTQNQPLPIIKPAPEFTLINQDNQTVSLSDFKGKVIMLGFIYTSCKDDLCDTQTSNFKVIQDNLGSYFGDKAMLLSLTLDPLYDTPNVLKSHGELYSANFSGWQFLTSTNLSTMENVIDDYDVLSYANELEELVNATDDNTTVSYKLNHENETHPSILIHSWVTMLLDENLMIRRVYTTVSWILSAAIRDMKSLLK